ncbi:MAG: glycosyltransferase family 4 protein [Anaerolineales bacterium]
MKLLLSANTDWYLYNFRRDLAEYLRARGVEVVMVSPPGPFVEKLRGLGFRWLAWQVGRQTLNPFSEVHALGQLVRLYKAERPELVHHHTIKPALYGTLAARRAGIPGVVNSITGRGYVFLGTDLTARVLRPLVRAVYRLAFAPPNVIATFENPADRDYFIANGLISPARARLIESVGVDPVRFHPQPEPEGTPIILMAARMLWDKGAGVLVEAARLLHTRQTVRVVLAGVPDPGNPASIPVETLQQWHQEGVVEWWGFQADMNVAYGQVHIAVLPTYYGEGVPTSLLEAAACGRAIVTTTIPGCQDFVTDGYNGLLVPPNDPLALANALETLVLDSGLRRRMGQAGRQRVLEKYTSELVNSATFAVYQELISV